MLEAMNTHLTPDEAIKRAGSVRALADILNVSYQAVQQYKLKGSIPPARLLQLMDLRPEWFKEKKQ